MENKKLSWCFKLKDGLKIVEPNENLSKSYLEIAKSLLADRRTHVHPLSDTPFFETVSFLEQLM